ncbi:MAG: histone deacetylase [Gemmatimonadales bacterium]|nr:histone deacetylase [Gemmatimonadales bacterium]
MNGQLLQALRRMGNSVLRQVRSSQAIFVYDKRYARSVSGVPMDPLRAERVLAFLREERLIGRPDLTQPKPVTLRRLLEVHSSDYLDSLQTPATLTGILGVEVTAAQLEEVLDLQRLMVGGTVQATRMALRSGRIGVNLGGGFHHATPERGMGFCVFNDIAVSITRLRSKGYDRPVMVIDLDMHDGNGTRAAFADDSSVYTFSLHHSAWDDAAAVADTSIALGPGVTGDLLLETLRRELPAILGMHRPELVIYVAGSDAAHDDRLGDWQLTDAGMLARDQFVIETLRAQRPAPSIAVVLGGGYGDRAWRYSARFFGWLVSGRVVEPPGQTEAVLRRFRRFTRQFEGTELAAETNRPGWDLTEEELLGSVGRTALEERVLGHYTKHGIELMLERFGILTQIRALGFPGPTLEIVPGRGAAPTVRLLADSGPAPALMELKVARSRRVVPGLEMLFVEWLLLQNPRATFSPDHPQLPGQDRPGLGMLREIYGWLIVLCETLHLDGIAFVPSHYYMAALGRRLLTFLDPAAQARFEAMYDALGRLSLAEASHALETGRIRDAKTGERLKWQPSVMVVPVSPKLRSLLESPEYGERSAAERERIEVRLEPEDDSITPE